MQRGVRRRGRRRPADHGLCACPLLGHWVTPRPEALQRGIPSHQRSYVPYHSLWCEIGSCEALGGGSERGGAARLLAQCTQRVAQGA